jgi:hypothetical protein
MTDRRSGLPALEFLWFRICRLAAAVHPVLAPAHWQVAASMAALAATGLKGSAMEAAVPEMVLAATLRREVWRAGCRCPSGREGLCEAWETLAGIHLPMGDATTQHEGAG